MMEPQVTVRELRDAIPPHCFRASTLRSLAHLGFDVALLALLYGISSQVESPFWQAPIVFLQGTLFWALFVIGHDCGHAAFSAHPRLNRAIGHLLHTPLLVPFHAWRLSHRTHHRHTADVERDEAWPPLTRSQLRSLPVLTRFLRLRGFLFVFPLYLLRNGPARRGSHFDPEGPLFRSRERPAVRRSIRACLAMASALIAAGALFGPGAVARHWLAPWLVFSAWAALVTYLHHTDEAVPWYRGDGWSYLRGALATVDRRYGVFEWFHHDAGCHVVHHLFPTIPHYRLREAARAIEPLLGAHYRRRNEPIWRALLSAARGCQIVPEEGERVFYEPVADPEWAASPTGAGSSPATR